MAIDRAVLSGKVALVTGASSGLGRHFARVLAQAGAKVGLAARRTDALIALAEEISGQGGEAAVVRLDVTDSGSISAAVAATTSALGPFVIVLSITAVMTFVKAPPVGGFLDDYEQAALARGVDVPAFEEAQGVTPEEWVQKETSDVSTQGGVGAIVLVVVYVATVLRGSRSQRARRAAPQRTSA